MQAGPWASYSSYQAVVPSDTTPINCRALWINVTVAGNIVLQNNPTNGGVSTTFAFAVGTYLLPVELQEGIVHATGLTATASIVALA
jgi:hypothetical protein